MLRVSSIWFCAGLLSLLLGSGGLLCDARAQPMAPPTNLYDRSRLDLSGQWHYLVDPMRTGIAKRKYRRDFPADTPEPPDAGGRLLEYNWDAAPTLRVPGAWNTEVDALRWYEGLVWLRTRFAHDLDPGQRAFLVFEGANYETQVFLNGTRLGMHEGGFTPFAFEVTDHLAAPLRADGRHSLVVAVDNTRRVDALPAADFDWWNYGGLTRPVSLVILPETFIHTYTLTFSENEGAENEGVEKHGEGEDGEGKDIDPDASPTLDAVVNLDGPDAAGQMVRVALPRLGIAETTTADATGRAVLRLALPADGFTRWTPDAPTRYAVRITAGSDAVTERMGLRTVATRGTELLLNGEPIFLRGICLHEEAFTDGTRDAMPRRALDWSDAEALLRAAKDLNANFVRLAHYPHTEKMTRLADRLGLMVWSEVPIYWEDVAFQNPKTLALARGMLRAMIERDRHRASIILWSVANETPRTDARLSFLRTLISDVRRHDATRLVTAALKVSHDGREKRVDDPLGAEIDVLAVNTYTGWYGTETPDAIPTLRWQTPYEKPVVFSEFGAGATPGFRGDISRRWTEDFQAYFIDQTMNMAVDVPFVRGTMPWILKDFRSPRRYHGRYQQYWNRKGLLDEAGRPKQAYSTLRTWYDRLANQRPSIERPSIESDPDASSDAPHR